MNSFFRSLYKYSPVLWVMLLILGSCANPVAPTGGPKDVTPPEVTHTDPADRSVNFAGKSIVLTFNEFVSLKDINNQLIVSPPLKEFPTFQSRGKSVVMKFKEPWLDHTTYNIFFGDAIGDITEGNVLAGYKFTFSTGPVLDSMMIEGKLINAFNLAPVANACVVLYDTIYDSIPYKQMPYYVTKTNKQGEFSITNVRDMDYLLFALTDLNANYIYDIPGEEIAFADTLVHPWSDAAKPESQVPDSSKVKADSLRGRSPGKDDFLIVENNGKRDTVRIAEKGKADSLRGRLQGKNDYLIVESNGKRDTVRIDGKGNADSLRVVSRKKQYIQLVQFKEVDSTQSLLKAQLVKDNVLNFSFRLPLKSPDFELLSSSYDRTPITGSNKMGDTLTMWLPGYTSDSIFLKISDRSKVIDTVEMSVKVRAKTIKKNVAPIAPALTIKNNTQSGRLKPLLPLQLTFADPLTDYKLESLKLLQDSLEIKPTSVAFADSVKTRLIIRYPWKEGIRYSLTIPDSTFRNIFDLANDSLHISFMGTKEEETSILTLKIDTPGPCHYLIQLLDSKEKIIEQQTITDDRDVEFKYIAPGKYKVKAIEDKNGNGYWDTGNYLKKKFPERVTYFTKELDLRANWTNEETWSIFM